jgi:hypothetical protein
VLACENVYLVGVRRLLIVGLFVLLPATARALDPFEIQVYEGDINQPRQVGLEVHSNIAIPRPDPPGPWTPASESLLRITLEPSFGLLEWWELGAYLQSAFELGKMRGHAGGFKLRSKWIVPRRLTGSFIFGLNVEVGRGSAAFLATDWDTEFRPILVWLHGPWMLAANPMIGWALTGPERGLAPDIEPALKARCDTGLGFGVGAEYYAGLGHLGSPAPLGEQEHVVYLIADLVGAPFDLNLGVGRGVTGSTAAWTFKSILGLGF